MKVYNPTGYAIEAMADGKTYIFNPHEEKEIWDIDHFKILLRHSKYKGLVHLVYDEQMQSRYPSFEEFKKSQAHAGLKALRDHFRNAYVSEKQAIREIKESKGGVGGEFDEETMDPRRFEKEVKIVDKWIAELDSSVGRKRKGIESSDNAHEAAA